MKKIFVAALISMVALVGCSANSGPAPAATVTKNPEVQSDTSSYIYFVRENGGLYASVSSDGDLLSMGNSICNGFKSGLSEEQVVRALSQALVDSEMDNEAGALFGATLIVGAKRYLCSGAVA